MKSLTRAPAMLALAGLLLGLLGAAVILASDHLEHRALTVVIVLAIGAAWIVTGLSATVAVRRVNGHAQVEIRDDGVGAADSCRGSGLRGLADRVGALDGSLALDSPPGSGTTLRAEIPV